MSALSIIFKPKVLHKIVLYRFVKVLQGNEYASHFLFGRNKYYLRPAQYYIFAVLSRNWGNIIVRLSGPVFLKLPLSEITQTRKIKKKNPRNHVCSKPVQNTTQETKHLPNR